ncbi:Scr1 family TA system antitoxin-like transcriptional regulator [Streptomyces sp. NPDC052773]|uniref:Scr1 family TA system antitoxin-like transcriptional regulator n=1 Tax=Streptomyces sp. NPDC052773 TaxID=3365693 RepID=UPI0037D7682C
MPGSPGCLRSSTLSLGVIPFTAQRAVWPMATFTIFDEDRVHADSLDAATTLTEPSRIALCAEAFDHLAGDAVHGAEARTLIRDAPAALDSAP